MDISAATAGLYSVPIFNVPPSAGMQAAQLSAPNPNATSPRPSILRKRTSEGYVVSYCHKCEQETPQSLVLRFLPVVLDVPLEI